MTNFFLNTWVNFVNNLLILLSQTCVQTSTVFHFLITHLNNKWVKPLFISFLFPTFPKMNPHLLDHKISLKNHLYTQSTKPIYYDYYI